MKSCELISVNGQLCLYGGIEEGEYSKKTFHKVYDVDIDEEGTLTFVGSTWYVTDEELTNDKIKFTKPQWYGIVEVFIHQDYPHLTDEDVKTATEDIVGREFAYGRPKTIKELKKHIAIHMNR